MNTAEAWGDLDDDLDEVVEELDADKSMFPAMEGLTIGPETFKAVDSDTLTGGIISSPSMAGATISSVAAPAVHTFHSTDGRKTSVDEIVDLKDKTVVAESDIANLRADLTMTKTDIECRIGDLERKVKDPVYTYCSDCGCSGPPLKLTIYSIEKKFCQQCLVNKLLDLGLKEIY